jgi:uncharacterized protein affecting Mg2+/Co2+ transport
MVPNALVYISRRRIRAPAQFRKTAVAAAGVVTGETPELRPEANWSVA